MHRDIRRVAEPRCHEAVGGRERSVDLARGHTAIICHWLPSFSTLAVIPTLVAIQFLRRDLHSDLTVSSCQDDIVAPGCVDPADSPGERRQRRLEAQAWGAVASPLQKQRYRIC
jgi:hypothetical protein